MMSNITLKDGRIYEIADGIGYEANFREAIEIIIEGYGIDKRMEIKSSLLSSYVVYNLENIEELREKK